MKNREFNNQASMQTLYFLWAIAFIYGFTFEFRDSTEVLKSAVSASVVHKILCIAIIILFIFRQSFVKKNRTFFKGAPFFLLMFTIWRFITAIWSPIPIWTLYRSYEFLVILGLSVYTINNIHTVKAFQHWLNFVWGLILLIVLNCYFGIFLFQDEALKTYETAFLPFQLQGVVPRLHPTRLAQFAGILLLVSSIRIVYLGLQKKYIFAFSIGLITLILSQGRTAIGGTVATFLTYFIFNRTILFGYFLSFFIALLSFIIPKWHSIVYEFLSRGQSTEMVLSLSTRVDWWNLVFNYTMLNNKLIEGFGAFVGSRIMMQQIFNDSRITLDNAWLDLIIDSGIIGCVLFFFVVIIILRRIIKVLKASTDPILRMIGFECSMVFVLILFRSVFVSSITYSNSLVLFIIVVSVELLTKFSSHGSIQ